MHKQIICEYSEVECLVREEKMISADLGKEAGHVPDNVCDPMSIICFFLVFGFFF